MHKLTLKTTLSALLVSFPLAGALADNNEGPSPEIFGATGSDWQVDRTYTSSIGAAHEGSYATLLDSQLRAAEGSLVTAERDGYVDPGRKAQARSDIQAIRQAAAQERQANGGALSESSYRALSEQVRVLNQNIHSLQIGG